MTKTDYIIVTGATGAIGRQICFNLYRQGFNLILAARNAPKAEALAKDIMDDYQRLLCESLSPQEAQIKLWRRPKILFLKLDLASKKGTMLATKDLKQMVRSKSEKYPTDRSMGEIEISALINNAGIMCRNFSKNSDGQETTMAVNYRNTKLFTESVMALMREGAQVIFTTSITRLLHRHHKDSHQITKNNFSQLGTYGLSKRMITDFAASLAKQYSKSGIRINCVDPGIVNTGMITMHRWFDPIADKIFRPLIRTPKEGAEPALRAFLSDQNGKIFGLHSTKELI